MTYKLPPSVYSRDQLFFYAEKLAAYIAALRNSQMGGNSAKDINTDELKPVLDLLPKSKTKDQAVLFELKTGLEEQAERAPLVGLTLAAPASHKLREDLVTWLRAKVRPDLLIDFHVNPDIAGGLVIRTPNHIYDESFRSRLLDSPKRFVEVLDRV